MFTITRSGSIYDAIADAAGVLLSILLWFWIKRVKNIK
jgi:VanZ family protein